MIATAARSPRTPHTFRFALAFAALSLLLALAGAVLAGPALAAPGHAASGAQNCARGSLSAAPDRAGEVAAESSCTRPSSTLSTARFAVGCCVAAKAERGGIGPVRLGQAGEDAVRGAYNIGDKVPITVGTRTRIPDGLTDTTLSEVKNVASLSYSRQLRDFEAYARANNLRFDLYVRGGPNATRLSGPLRAAIQDPASPLRLRRIP